MIQAKKIYVGNIAEITSEKQLSEHFLKAGTVLSVHILKVISFKKNANYGYVTMSTIAETEQAIRTLNNSILDGSKIRVLEAHSVDQEKNVTNRWQKRVHYAKK
jgi:RNA recognition motif-containing protein